MSPTSKWQLVKHSSQDIFQKGAGISALALTSKRAQVKKSPTSQGRAINKGCITLCLPLQERNLHLIKTTSLNAIQYLQFILVSLPFLQHKPAFKCSWTFLQISLQAHFQYRSAQLQDTMRWRGSDPGKASKSIK